jgi:DNA-binding transcriptional ArsR family regulator
VVVRPVIVNLVVHYQNLDQTFAALADPVRRTVIARLTKGEAPVSALAADHAISLPAFMKHVRTLERAGLVVTEKVGRVRTCRLRDAALASAEQWLQTHRVFWKHQLAALAALVESQPPQEEPWPSSPPSRSKFGKSSRPRRLASTTRGRRRRT